jgi:ring-1,2-phenylacetyl-CoA epoxidase subunit PaaE
MITVKRVDNGEFSRHLLDNVTEGSSLYTIGAAGFFTLPDKPSDFADYVFYAAGSGITPILPLMKTLLFGYEHARITLFFSNQSLEETIFSQEIVKLEKRFRGRLRVEWFFSTAKDLLKARISKATVAKHVASGMFDPANSLFYLCGPSSFMQMISISLVTEGVGAPRIRKEIFDTAKPVVKELPPDTNKHRVTVRYKGATITFEMQYPQTILEAAKNNGIMLPYSCEAGKCGTCAATCVSGQVWMSYNEVLLDKEISQGRVLTCTGYAVGIDLALAYPEPE